VGFIRVTFRKDAGIFYVPRDAIFVYLLVERAGCNKKIALVFMLPVIFQYRDADDLFPRC